MNVAVIDILQQENAEKIVVYGAAPGDKMLLSQFKKYFSIYEMDLERGIGSLEEVIESGIDAVILLKQMISRQDLFARLMEYSAQYSVPIYDLSGHKINEICNYAVKKTYSSWEELREEIQKHEYISFDIFDTLLTRMVLTPADVFQLVERRLEQSGIKIRNFQQKRIKAQETFGLTNPTLDEIYQKLQKLYGISREVADFCEQQELEIETEVLVPREDMVGLYTECVNAGKTVCLVSDMYIPAPALDKILREKGIVGYKKIYVSCDRRQLKIQGLFNTYKMETDAESDSFLHIGDTAIHDGICAELAGMDYCLIANGMKAAEKTALKDVILSAETLEERVMLGMIIAKLFNSPFKLNVPIQIQSDYEYGYSFCAALICGFALWVYSEVKEKKYDDILFASRDGFLIKKLYDQLRDSYADTQMPAGKYFYCSRKAAVMTGINNEAFINMIIDISAGMPPRKMMRERFGLSTENILKYSAEKYDNSVHKYVWAHAPAIFARAEKAKLNYFKYMRNIGLGIGKKYAFMDFVSSGTSQKALMRMAPFEMEGLYAGWNGSEDKESVRVTAFFEDTNSFFMRRYKIMETFMTSQEPSLNYFNDEGKPVFAKQDRSEKELRYVEEIQKACIDFLKQFISIVKPQRGAIREEFLDSIFTLSEGAVVLDKDSVLNHLVLMDDWRRKRNKIEQIIQ